MKLVAAACLEQAALGPRSMVVAKTKWLTQNGGNVIGRFVHTNGMGLDLGCFTHQCDEICGIDDPELFFENIDEFTFGVVPVEGCPFFWPAPFLRELNPVPYAIFQSVFVKDTLHFDCQRLQVLKTSGQIGLSANQLR
jgi:hypothetical protein